MLIRAFFNTVIPPPFFLLSSSSVSERRKITKCLKNIIMQLRRGERREYLILDLIVKQVNRYKKAAYKGFATRHEAILWLSQTKPNNNPYENTKKRKAYAYVDGSYNDKTGNYGYASILHYDGEVSYDMGLGQDKIRNLAGEFLAAMAAD